MNATTTLISTPIFDKQIVALFASVPGELAKSTASFFWSAITYLWSGYWYIILPALFLWGVFEYLTRDGNIHYNSKNGFSPTLNRVVGSGVYLLLQTIVYALIHFIFGDNAYTNLWPYALHLLVFASTKKLLKFVGFWVY